MGSAKNSAANVAVALCQESSYLESRLTNFSLYLLLKNANPAQQNLALYENVAGSFQRIIGQARRLMDWSKGCAEIGLEEFSKTELQSAWLLVRDLEDSHNSLATAFYEAKDTSNVFENTSENACEQYFINISDSLTRLSFLFKSPKEAI